MRPDHAVFLGALIFVIVASGLTGAALDRAIFWPDEPQTVHEAAAPGDLPNGLLPRAAEAPAPRGTVRTITAVIQPEPVAVTCSDGTAVQAECPPVRVRTVLTRDEVGTLRARVYAEDGTLLDGLDQPHEPLYLPPPTRVWAAGYELDEDGRQGAFIERDVGRLRVGASLVGDTVSARVGWRW